MRIDSGDLVDLSKQVRAILDSEGLQDVGILASGGLDEHDLHRFMAADAPIDAYGIGTRLGTSADAPSLDMVYKLVQFGEVPKLKLSAGKATLVGPKQVWRRAGLDGLFVPISSLAVRSRRPAMSGSHCSYRLCTRVLAWDVATCATFSSDIAPRRHACRGDLPPNRLRALSCRAVRRVAGCAACGD